MAQATGITSVVNSTIGGALKFQLADVPSVTEFPNLFDLYKIVKAEVMFMPRVTEAATNAGYGNFFYWRDYDDASTPGSLAQVLQIQGVKLRQAPSRMFKISVAPRPTTVMNDNAGVSNPAGFNKAGWIDTTYGNIPHYGIKYFWTDVTTVATMDVYVRYTFKFRGVR